eukprot:300722_1
MIVDQTRNYIINISKNNECRINIPYRDRHRFVEWIENDNGDVLSEILGLLNQSFYRFKKEIVFDKHNSVLVKDNNFVVGDGNSKCKRIHCEFGTEADRVIKKDELIKFGSKEQIYFIY